MPDPKKIISLDLLEVFKEEDDKLYVAQRNLQQKYNTISTYNVGDLVFYNNLLYKCITAVSSPEEFNPSKWQQVHLSDVLDEKVDKAEGMGLSHNDFTDALKNKLDGIATGAQVNVIEGIQLNGSNIAPVDKIVNIDLTNDYYNKTQINSQYTTLDGKIDGEIRRATGAESALDNKIDTHIGNKSNPHEVTKAQVGLGYVENTGDSATPVQGGTTKFTTGGAYVLKTTIDTHIANKSNPHEVTKAQVGLGYVVNTGDSNTPTENGTTKFTTGGAYVLKTAIDTINSKIPNQASASNQLADKDFVNSTVNSLAAFYITKNAQGDPFATYAELASATVFYSGGEVRVPTRNDYCIVVDDENHDDASCRYIYQGGQWEFQFVINETPFTSDQLAAINSGITAALVGQITTNANNIENKVDKEAGKGLSTNDFTDALKDKLDGINLNLYYTKTESDNRYVQKTTTIAGIALSSNISAQALTDALVFMNNTTDLDYVMED